jgi:uncharacterized phage protein (TIGR02218 family)
MKPTNATLNALLATRQFFAVDLYQITLNNGTVLYYCQGQSNITYGGHTYLAGGQTGPYFDRKDNKAKVRWVLGSGTDTLVVDVIPGSSTIFNLPFLSAVRSGIFDAADFQLYRAFMSVYGTVQTGCAVLMFRGRVAEVDADRSLATFTVNDYRELFSQQLPRNLFAASCPNSLGDATCTVNLASYTASGTALSGSEENIIYATLAAGSDYYDNGSLMFTSGLNLDISYGVSQWSAGSPGTITLLQPTYETVNAGDTFTIVPGCDKTTGSGGCMKFNNLANFRGQPYTPAPETAL